ncbi:sensor histidine kinase [Duganella sp. PWIR1]
MDERLRYRIDASDEARLAVMPTLMLQPLVENAINHGLAPKRDGGSVLVDATVRAGRLQVRVVDDGVGLDAHGHRKQAGAGMALANLRSRLHTQFCDNASLTLRQQRSELSGERGGVEAVLDLPYVRRATAPAMEAG